jgi:phage baseplate assembly protein W
MDFYVRTKGDPNYDKTKIHSESELAQLIGQLETMLFTNRGEVMGEPEFGANLNDLVYSLNYNEGQIQNVIDDQVEKYIPLAKKYNLQTTVQFYKGNVRDIAKIDITIDSKYQVGVYIN